ncbi:f-box and wd repeat-containing protein [Lichtheimia corymbifera JMRC:FSU:9682]|uniref:F-box and wd repeat-containing protein n=1 Tax=Lichtheimia corymbifera JMRC:FSU:9682 TaxID=1263082 RepID=A0A068RHB4_9FUNG|nr:f-box and wd repeat-containing protein [Lichtheimia corymbifera JMRC:FSU:9682]
MSLCTATEDDLSPPATPPSSSSSTSTTTSHDNDHHRCSSPPHHPRLYTSYVDLSMGGSPQKLMSRMDSSRLEYIWSVKDTFTQLNNKQQQLLLSELLLCCDNQLLAFVHSLIAPKLKIDFLRQLPIELSLHILQYVNDPYTLTRASQVSVFWNMLLKDESIWKRMCQRHLELQRRRQMSPHSTLPQLPISKATTALSIRSFRHYYKRLYTIDGAWNKGGGKLTSCPNNIQSSLVTSLQVQDPFIVVGCDNHRIEVFDSITGNHVRTLTGHEGGVWALQFVKVSEQETILVSGGCDRELRVWELNSGTLRHVLRGHSSTIRCLKMRDAQVAVTGSRDATLRIWDVQRGTLKHLCVGHQASVRCIDIHDNRVASGSYDHTARLWDMDTGECLQTFTGHHSQIYAVVFDGTRVMTGSLDSTIRVWSASSGQCLATLQGHTSLVGHLQLLPSDPSLLVSGGSDGCLRVWDLDRYECRHRISAHDNSVTCLQFDDRRILSGGSDGRVKLWDLETGTLVRTFTKPARTVWKLQFNDTKAVVVMQRSRATNRQTTAIELHDFDILK